MSKSLAQVSSAPIAAGRNQAIVAKRIRFSPQARPGAKVLRTFQQPRPCVAVEEAMELGELPAKSAWPEPLCGELLMLWKSVIRHTQARKRQMGAQWLLAGREYAVRRGRYSPRR